MSEPKAIEQVHQEIQKIEMEHLKKRGWVPSKFFNDIIFYNQGFGIALRFGDAMIYQNYFETTGKKPEFDYA